MYCQLYRLHTHILNLAEMCHIYKHYECNLVQFSYFEELGVISLMLVLQHRNIIRLCTLDVHLLVFNKTNSWTKKHVTNNFRIILLKITFLHRALK